MRPTMTAQEFAQDPIANGVASPCPTCPDPGSDVATRFVVAGDFTDPQGQQFLCVPLSPAYLTAPKAQAELEQLRGRFPDARLQKTVTLVFPEERRPASASP